MGLNAGYYLKKKLPLWLKTSSPAPQSGSGSHPVIEFKQLPIASGPLLELEKNRKQILTKVSQATIGSLEKLPTESLISEALYTERARLKRQPGSLFRLKKIKQDRQLWGQVRKALIKPPAQEDRNQVLKKIVSHYAEEIGGHFDPRVYAFTTRAVPWGFNWLLNAASVRRFLPWGQTESLQSCMHLQGEIPTLQSLAKKGTILLVPTHQSNLDSVLIGYFIYLMSLPPFAYGAGLNLFNNPILSFFMSRLGAYTVDRAKSSLIYKETLKNYSVQILKEGVHSIFFPGGGRSRTGAIEGRLKLGLLGTALEAQIEGMLSGKKNPKIFIVPIVLSYHFVLEAGFLIENYLEESGKHRYLLTEDESWHPSQVLRFFWKGFSSQTAVTARVGKPLDVFGNFVDELGNSIGPNGTLIDPARWLTTGGVLKSEPERDQEYTRELGLRLAERFHKENTVLSSHLLAFTFFEALRKKYPDFDLYRLLRLTVPQRTLPLETFLKELEQVYNRLLTLAQNNELFLEFNLLNTKTQEWIKLGAKQLGLYHDSAVLKIQKEQVWTEDMNLLYYYRNRLSGYRLSLLAHELLDQTYESKSDSKGFLV